MTKINEFTIEDIAIRLFDHLGYHPYVPDINPVSETSLPEGFEDVLPLKLMSGEVRVDL